MITLAAAAGVCGTAALGCWQLDRAAQKQVLAAAIDSLGRQAPLDAAALAQAVLQTPAADLVHRPVVLRGRWLAAQTVYLDNRQMHGRPGFFVLTPLALDGPGSAVVLVQRGWIPRNFQDRTALARVDTPAGPVAVAGRLALAPARLYEMAPGADPVSDTSPIRQNLDIARFRAQTGLPLLALTVVETGRAGSGTAGLGAAGSGAAGPGPDSDGLERDWPRIDAGVDKHYGYAFQWFAISLLTAGLYVWFQLLRRFIRPRRPPAP